MQPINVYIFSNSSRSSIFGIGTYIRELTACLTCMPINLSVVYLYSEKEELTIEKQNRITYWHFPAPGYSIASNNAPLQDKRYFRNVARLLAVHIEVKTQIVFHLNNNVLQTLAEALKSNLSPLRKVGIIFLRLFNKYIIVYKKIVCTLRPDFKKQILYVSQKK